MILFAFKNRRQGLPDMKKDRFFKPLLFVSTIFCAAVAAGCLVGARLGGQPISRQVLSDHRYYHIAWDTRPYAIVALRQPYYIRSNFWLPFEAEPVILQKRVDALEVFIERGYNRAYGYYLVDRAGNRIGVWYSSIYIFSASVNKADNSVTITMDRPWVTGDRFGL